MKRTQELKFESEPFDLARSTLDSVLGKTISDMLIKASDEATITLKINLQKDPDGNWHLIDGDPQMRLEDFEED